MLHDWGCKAGGKAPKFWRDLATETLASQLNRSIDVELGEKVYAFFLVPIADAGYVNSYGRDITERKRMEKELLKSEEKFRSIAERSIDSIFTIDAQGRLTYCSPATKRIIGYTHEELFGKPFLSFLPESEISKLTLLFNRLIDGENFQGVQTTVLKKDGLLAHVEINASPITKEGKVVGAQAILRDITERRMAEGALKKSETLLNEVGEMAKMGGWELDVETKNVYWTRETYQIHEILEEEKFDLKKAVLFFDTPGRSTLETALQRGMEKREPFDLELPFTSAKGRHLWTRAMGQAVRVNGKVVKLMGAFQDITERKRMESELKRHSEHLEELVQERTRDLRENEARLRSSSLYVRSLIEASLDPLVTISPDGKITDVNKATELVTEISRDQLIGSDFSGYFTDPEKAKRGYEEASQKNS